MSGESPHAQVTLTWGDGRYVFRLAIDQLRELQEKTKAGPPTIFARLIGRQWYVDDVRETIRLGLIGGGMPAIEALLKVERYVDKRPLLESVETALLVMQAALVGPEEGSDQKRKPEGAAEKSNPSSAPTEGSTSEPSTASEPRSASGRGKSDGGRSGSSAPQSTDTPESTPPARRSPLRRQTTSSTKR